MGESPHLRHRRHGLHIVRDDFFIAYIKVISSLIPSFLLSPKSYTFRGPRFFSLTDFISFVTTFYCLDKSHQLTYLHEVPILNKKEDETLFKTGNSQKTTPSNASSSIYSLLNKLQNVNNTDTKFLLDVDRFSND